MGKVVLRVKYENSIEGTLSTNTRRYKENVSQVKFGWLNHDISV